jgi:DNA gyrase/topoisomerase IV subunit A
MIQHNITDSLESNYMPYSAHVILDRALVEIDGFKPSQRRILYTMYKMGLLKGGRKKSQGIVGQTMFLHPHGDGSIYETLVHMSKDYDKLLLPYVDSKGNFGKHYSRDMAYASARYTEARLMPIAKELFEGIDRNAVDMVDSYDGSLKEPRLLPVRYPNVLTNVQSGTAVAMGSNIASFNLNEVIDATIAYIKNRNTDITEIIKAPDFPSGGQILYEKEKFDNILKTGRGSFDMRATYRFDGNSIYFEELPFGVKVEVIIDRIVALVKDGKLKEVVNIHDNNGIGSTGIEVVTKANTNKEALVGRLFAVTPLQSSFGCNFNMIIGGSPKVLGVKGIIHEWVVFRAECIRREAGFDWQKKSDKRHLLLALKQVLLDIDKAVKIIRETKKNSEVVANLMKAFGIDKVQAEYVSDIKLKHLNKEYLIQRISEIETLEKEIAALDKLMNDRVTLAKLIISQLSEVKENYGQERKSELVKPDQAVTANVQVEKIDNYNVKIFVTKQGYLKKIPLTSLRGNFTIKVKDGDKMQNVYETTNDSDILVYTNKQNVYKLQTHELEDHKASTLGEYLPTLLGLRDENILFVTVTKDYSGFLLIAFENGKLAKIDLKSYETKQNRKVLKNAYSPESKPVYFNCMHEDVELAMISNIDKVAIFNTRLVNVKSSKTTQGVQLMKTKKDSLVNLVSTLDNCSFADLDYYRLNGSGVGKYIKKEDSLKRVEGLDLQ